MHDIDDLLAPVLQRISIIEYCKVSPYEDKFLERAQQRIDAIENSIYTFSGDALDRLQHASETINKIIALQIEDYTKNSPDDISQMPFGEDIKTGVTEELQFYLKKFNEFSEKVNGDQMAADMEAHEKRVARNVVELPSNFTFKNIKQFYNCKLTVNQAAILITQLATNECVVSLSNTSFGKVAEVLFGYQQESFRQQLSTFRDENTYNNDLHAVKTVLESIIDDINKTLALPKK